MDTGAVIRILKEYYYPFAVSSFSGIMAAMLLLMAVHLSFLKIPSYDGYRPTAAKLPQAKTEQKAEGDTYRVIEERNLFRARLKIEIPKPKSEKQIEEEALTNIMRPMTLKGIWTGQSKGDIYAVVDRGPQKGVWIYRVGDSAERGLVVTEITESTIVFTKSDFIASLKLFTKGYERKHVPAVNTQAEPPAKTTEKPKAAPPPPPPKTLERPKTPPTKGPR